jgi:vitamin B12 transporter
LNAIEIVKGAMSSLYGSDAIGGVINIITKSATKTETAAQFSAGTDKLVKGSISQIIKEGAFSGLLNADSLYTNGYSIIDGADFDSGYKNTGANIKLNYDFGSTNIGLSMRRNQGTAEYIKTSFNYVTNKITAYKPLSQDFLNQVTVLSVNSEINSVVTSQLRLSQMTDEIDQNQNNDITHTTQKQADWQNTFALNSNNTLVFGVTMTDTQAEYNAAYKQSLKNKAVYLQNQWQAQSFNLQASVRHEDYDSFGTHNTGNIGLGYHMSPTQLVYINAGSAFKAPDLNQLYAPSSNNLLLKPEESRSFEVGSKHQLGAFAITNRLISN